MPPQGKPKISHACKILAKKPKNSDHSGIYFMVYDNIKMKLQNYIV
jgi:inhibitor of KinA sporulation pathway (predicted exonuclease)